MGSEVRPTEPIREVSDGFGPMGSDRFCRSEDRRYAMSPKGEVV